MPSLFSLFVDLKANTADFISGMSGASYAAKKAGRDIESSFSSLGGLAEKALAPLGSVGEAIGSSLAGIAEAAGKAGSSLATLGSLSIGGAFGGIAGTAIAAGAAMTALAIKGSEVVESFARISEKTGISISDLQVFSAAGQSVGVSLDDVVSGIRKFDQVITDSGRGTGALQGTLHSLGITATDNKGALLQLADAFSQMQDGPRKDAIAIELLGRSGLNLIPILDKGRAGIEQFQAIVGDFGPNITSGAIAATENWQMSTLKLSEAWDKVEVSLTENFLPTLGQIAQRIASLLADQDTATALKIFVDGFVAAAGIIDTAWSGLKQTGAATMFAIEMMGIPLVAIYKAAADAIAGHFAQAWEDIKRGAADAQTAISQFEDTSSKIWSDNANFIKGSGLGSGESQPSHSMFDPAQSWMKSLPSSEDSYKSVYDALAAGGKTQLDLLKEQAQLASDVNGLLWKEAAADEAKIASLKQILALEEQRKKIYDEIGARIGTGALAHPTLASGALSVYEGSSLTRQGTGESPTVTQLRGARAPVAAPDVLGYGTQTSQDQPPPVASVQNFKSAGAEFWKQYGDSASDTFAQINARFSDMSTNFKDLLSNEVNDDEASDADKIAAQTQYSAISAQLERDRLKSIADLRKAQDDQAISDPLNLTSFGNKFKAFADQIAIEGQGLGPKLFSSMTTAVGGLEDQLAKLVVTGKANFKELFDSFAESAAKAGFQSIFGSLAGLATGKGGLPGSSQNAPGGTPGILSGSLGLAGTLGKTVGLGTSGAPDGSQASPFYVVPSSSDGVGALPTTGSSAFQFGGLNALFGSSSDSDSDSDSDSGSDALSSLASQGQGLWSDAVSGIEKVGSSIGSFFASIFSGGLAGGGDMDPGKAYLVGEKGPELMFAGKHGGAIAPITRSSGGRGGNTIHNHLNIQTPDADSFNRSSSQIMAQVHRASQSALARNG